jgi:peptidoglycan/xylan/chitin deacetylase (PgdA/CDA1 family)
MKKIILPFLAILSIALTSALVAYQIAPTVSIFAEPAGPAVRKLSVPILLYHHIATADKPSDYFVSPKTFERQMKWLKDMGYTVVSYADFYAAFIGEKNLPSNSVVITFDDGKRDQYENAYPILKKYGYPATFFIETGAIGEADTMTWEMVKDLADNGMEIGSHTLSHPYLSKTKPLRLVRYEIRKSRQVLTMNLDIPIRFFAYPSGAYTAETAEIVKNSGYLSAVTTDHGIYHRIGGDPYKIRRIYVFDDIKSFIRRVRGLE